jgi:pSer/pThr/pTyr-binding forkhead associated (FHA) protein
VIRVLVTDKEGKQRSHEFAKREVTLGRANKSDVVLDEDTVSKAHAKIVEKDGKHILVDLHSENGVFVNRKRLRSPQIVSDRDEIRIGPFLIRITKNNLSAAPPEKGRTVCPRCGGPLTFRNLADYCVACDMAFV